MNFLRQIILIFNYFCMAYTILLDSIYLEQLFVSFLSLRKNRKRERVIGHENYFNSENLLPLSVIVPANNEQENICENILALMTLEYPEFEIILVNDGSTDETHNRIVEYFELYEIESAIKNTLKTQDIRGVYYNPEYPNFIYVDKENGGKADALNAGINVSKYPLFMCIDADSMIEKDAAIKLSMEFMKDPNTVISGGMVRIANGSIVKNGEWKSFSMPKRRVAGFQIIEYFRAFLAGRFSWNYSNALLIISGAFGIFNKKIVIEAGGYKTNTIGEDMEIVVRVHKYMKVQKAKNDRKAEKMKMRSYNEKLQPKKRKKNRYRIVFVPEAVCWTQGPSTIKDLKIQRTRWQVGLMDTLIHNKRMIFNPRYGTVGMLSVPYFWLFELLGPIVETFGYIIIPLSFFMGEISLYFFVMFLLLSNLLGIILSLGGLILEQTTYVGYLNFKQVLNLTSYVFLENLGYRQYITVYRFIAMLRYKNLKNTWGKIKRVEFNKYE